MPRSGPGSPKWGTGGVARLLRLYQGPLQEEYGRSALIFIGGQSAVPAAAAEPALRLRAQVELGTHGAVLPALILLGQAMVLLRVKSIVTLLPWPGWARLQSCQAPARAPSPAAGRTAFPAPCPAACGPGSAHAPNAGGGRNSRSSLPGSKLAAGPRAAFPHRTPSLQGRAAVGVQCPRLGAGTGLRGGPDNRLWGQHFFLHPGLSGPGRYGHPVPSYNEEDETQRCHVTCTRSHSPWPLSGAPWDNCRLQD